MHNPPLAPSEQEFISLVTEGKFLEALSSVVGTSGKAINLSSRLLANLTLLEPEHQLRFLKWSCDSEDAPPTERNLPIPQDLRWFVEKVARHEIGHAVIALRMGFRIGNITVSINSSSGDHVGTTEMFLGRHTPDTKDIQQYLNHRITVLMAGAMSEDEGAENVGRYFKQAFDEAENDRSKAYELARLAINIQGQLTDADLHQHVRRMSLITRQMVAAEYGLISQVANDLAANIQTFGIGFGWTKHEFLSLPLIKQRFPAAHLETQDD